MTCLRAWLIVVQNLLASLVSPELLAAQVLLQTIFRLFNSTTAGLSQSGASLIGRLIGAQKIDLAKNYITHLIFIGFSISFVYLVILLAFGDQIIYIFTDIESLVSLVQGTNVILALSVFFEAISSCLNGPLRGLGV